jgi:hypothetical protein
MSRLDDGHATTISFAADTGVLLYEKTVTPPGMDAGGEVDTTTMENSSWRTRDPKLLKTLTNAGMVVAYDPAAYTNLMSLVGVNTSVTVTFPDGHTILFKGWLNTFTPGEHVEGERPTAEIEIIPSSTHETTGQPHTPIITAP